MHLQKENKDEKTSFFQDRPVRECISFPQNAWVFVLNAITPWLHLTNLVNAGRSYLNRTFFGNIATGGEQNSGEYFQGISLFFPQPASELRC